MSCHILPQSKITNISDSHTRKGSIQVIFGPMFSGKTTELLRRIKRYQIAKKKCVVIKYANDCRYDNDGVSTHDRQTLSALSALQLSELTITRDDFDVIGIDEGQFFPDIVSFCDKMAEYGKIVIVAALDGTFQRKGFGDILNLVPISESVVKLTAVCMGCFSEASYTKRKGRETEVEVIGGADKYEASCRECFKTLIKDTDLGKENRSIPIKSALKNTDSVPLTKHTTRTKRALSQLCNAQLSLASPPKVKV